MTDSWKCPHCGAWIGAMQVHEDCAREQDEKRRREEAERRDRATNASPRTKPTTELLGLALALLSACKEDCPTPGPHEIAHDDRGCVTMQVGCDSIYYTRCDGRPSTSDTECHLVQEGKFQRRVCLSASTVDPDDPGPGCCPRERAQ